jgi:protein disulfide-isomerase
MNNFTIKIQVWSDIACPFCFIGKRHLEKALNSLSESDKSRFDVEWMSYQLDPNLPEKSDLSITEYLSQRKGMPVQQLRVINERVSQMGVAAGIAFDFERLKVGNTISAHKLLQKAKHLNLGSAVKERLLKAYFEEGAQLGDRMELQALALESGLTESDFQDCFASEEWNQKLTENLQMAAKLGISGVPFFVFAEKYAVSGAQPVDVFQQVLQQLLSEFPLEFIQGEVCTPEGDCN